ncbi:MAG: hypothetical protein ACK5RE_18445 [Pseudanabaena sp.]
MLNIKGDRFFLNRKERSLFLYTTKRVICSNRYRCDPAEYAFLEK